MLELGRLFLAHYKRDIQNRGESDIKDHLFYPSYLLLLIMMLV